MKLEKADYKNLKGYKKTKLQGIIEEFVAMQTPCVKVDFSSNEYCSPSSASAAFFQAIKRMGVNGVKVRVVESQVYLLNTLLIDEL